MTIFNTFIQMHFFKFSQGSAVSNVKPDVCQWKRALHFDIGFPTVNSRIYCRKCLTLSSQMSHYIRQSIQILYWIIPVPVYVIFQSIAHEIQLIQGEPATITTTETITKQEPLIPTESKSAFTNLQNQQLQVITATVEESKNAVTNLQNQTLHIITDTGDVQEQIEIESSVGSIMNEWGTS